MNAISSAPAATPGADMQTLFDALAAGEVERARDVLADNVLLLLPGLQPVHGRRRALRLLRRLRRRYAEVRWTRASVLETEPGWSITTWTMTGRRQDGDPFRHEIASVARLDVEGRIAYLSDFLTSADRAGARSAPTRRPLERGR